MSEVLVERDRIQDVTKFFADLGGLHDAKVLQVAWAPGLSELTMSIDDLRANFLGFPEHSGATPATLIFGVVSRLSISGEAPNVGAVKLFDVECSSWPNAVSLLFSPGGRMEVEFESLTVVK